MYIYIYTFAYMISILFVHCCYILVIFGGREADMVVLERLHRHGWHVHCCKLFALEHHLYIHRSHVATQEGINSEGPRRDQQQGQDN